MSNSDRKKEDTRPAYVAPQVIRMPDIAAGIGGSCGQGGSPRAGTCAPTGNGPGLITCGQGNGAKGTCGNGAGVVKP